MSEGEVGVVRSRVRCGHRVIAAAVAVAVLAAGCDRDADNAMLAPLSGPAASPNASTPPTTEEVTHAGAVGDWQLSRIATTVGDETTQQHPEYTIRTGLAPPHITISQDGTTLVGHDGCNDFNAEFDITEPPAVTTGELISTAMGCSGSHLAFTSTLRSANSYRLRDGQLIVASPALTLTLRRPTYWDLFDDPQVGGLFGTWALVELTDLEGEVSYLDVIVDNGPNATITITQWEPQVLIHSGCIWWRALLVLTPPAVRFNRVNVVEDPGVECSDQRSRFATLANRARSYEIVGDTLFVHSVTGDIEFIRNR